MAADELPPRLDRLLAGLARLHIEFAPQVGDVEQEFPTAALDSLEDAVADAPADYLRYLEAALECYRGGLYRDAILMVWSAVIQHLYSVVGGHRGGVTEFEKANKARFRTSKKYREIKRTNDFLYMGERDFIQLGGERDFTNSARTPACSTGTRGSCSTRGSNSGTFVATPPATRQAARRRSSSSRA